MALTDRCFITLTELKSYLNITSSDATKDTWLESVIDLVCGSIEESVDTEVQPQDLDLIFDGNGSKVLNLGRYIEDLFGDTDSERLANLQSRSDSESDWEDLTDSMDNVEFDGRTIQLLDTVFPVGRKNIRVKFYAGFDPLPAKLKEVALEKCAMHFKESNVGMGQLGMGSMTMGGAGTTIGGSIKEMEARWQKVFDEYLETGDDSSVSTLYI